MTSMPTTPPLAVALSPWLLGHWFRLALVLLGLALLLAGLLLRRRAVLAWSLAAPGTALVLFAAGGILFPSPAGSFFGTAGWLLTSGAAGIVLLVALLLLVGFWN